MKSLSLINTRINDFKHASYAYQTLDKLYANLGKDLISLFQDKLQLIYEKHHEAGVVDGRAYDNYERDLKLIKSTVITETKTSLRSLINALEYIVGSSLPEGDISE